MTPIFRKSKKTIERCKIDIRKERSKIKRLIRDVYFLVALDSINKISYREYLRRIQNLEIEELTNLKRTLEAVLEEKEPKGKFLAGFSKHIIKYGPTTESDRLRERYLQDRIIRHMSYRIKS